MEEIIIEWNQKYLKDTLFYKNVLEMYRKFTYYIVISFESLRNLLQMGGVAFSIFT